MQKTLLNARKEGKSSVKLTNKYASNLMNTEFTAGIEIRCSHLETRTRTVTDGNGNRRTEHYTETVVTFLHFYDFSELVKSKFNYEKWDSNDLEIVLKNASNAANRDEGRVFLEIESEFDIKSSNFTSSWIENIRTQLYAMNHHRDSNCEASYNLQPVADLVSNQMITLYDNDKILPWFISKSAYLCYWILCISYFYKRDFEKLTSSLKLEFHYDIDFDEQEASAFQIPLAGGEIDIGTMTQEAQIQMQLQMQQMMDAQLQAQQKAAQGIGQPQAQPQLYGQTLNAAQMGQAQMAMQMQMQMMPAQGGINMTNPQQMQTHMNIV
jgi:hypothetical protein